MNTHNKTTFWLSLVAIGLSLLAITWVAVTLINRSANKKVIPSSLLEAPTVGNFYPYSSSPTYIVVGDENYPPFSYMKNGQPAGFDVDVIRAAAHAIGANVEIRLMPWEAAKQALLEGKADLIAGMAYSPERAKIFEFSNPYTTVSFDVFVRQNSNINKLSDLKDQEVIIQRGGVMEDYLPQLAENITPILVDNPVDALRMLASGKSDAAILNRIQGYYIIDQYNLANIKAANVRILPLDYSIAALRQNNDLIMDFNEGLNILKSNGDYKALTMKWFGLYEQQSFWDETKYYFYGLAITVAILFVAASWVWLLRRQVRSKTQDLVRSENKYRKLVENISEAVLVTIADRVIFVNQQAEQLLGLNPMDLTPAAIVHKMLPEGSDVAFSEFDSWYESGDIRSSKVFSIKLPSGENKWVNAIYEKITWDDQPAVLYLLMDITLEKETQLALAESETKFRTAFESAAVGLVISSLDGKILQVNETFSQFLGYSVDELANRNWREITHPDDIQKNAELLDETIQGTKKIARLEKRYICRDGNILWADVSTALMKNPIGEPLYYITYIQNITEKKKAEQKLSESEERFRTIFENASVSLWEEDFTQVMEWVDQKKREGVTNFNTYFDEYPASLKELTRKIIVKDVNNAALKMYHSNSKDELRNSLDKIVPDASLSQFKHEILAFINGDPYFEGETINRTLTGEKLNALVTTNIPVETGDYSRVLVSLTDITRLKNAEERIHQQLQHLAALRSVDMAISASMDIQITLRVLINQVKTQLNVDAVAILLLNPHTQTLDYAAAAGFKTRAIENVHLRMGQSYAGRVALERRTIIMDNVNDPDQTLLLNEKLFSEKYAYFAGIPLIAKGTVKGVLEVFSYSTFSSEPEWINLLEAMASQAAIAIDNATMFDDVQRANTNLMLAYDATIEGWARALELRDDETEGHSKRVTELATALAAEVGIQDEELVHVRRGAFLHDIGKMGIPDRILLKPGPLTEEEWKIMKMHPVWGKQLLESIDFLKPAIYIPYCHHERWDGTGYPRGLMGIEIPLAARVFSIVDGYDALSSNRPYRKAWPEEDVVKYLKENAGKIYDPDIVPLFMKILGR